MKIKPLSQLVRRHRRLIYAQIAWCAAMIVAGGVGTALFHGQRWWLLWSLPLSVITIAIGSLTTLGALMVFHRARHRATELQTSPGAWRAPLTLTRSSPKPMSGMIAFAAIFVTNGPTIYRPEDALFSSALIALWFIIFVTGSVLTWWTIRRGSRELRLTADGIHIPRALGSYLVRWDDIHLRGISYYSGRRTSVTLRYGPYTTEDILFPSIVEPRFLATVIAHYTEFPDERATIGTDPGYAHLLRVLGVTPQPIGADS